MKLSIFLQKNELSYREFSRQVPCSISMLSQVISKKRKASSRLALLIERATGYEVTRDEVLYPELYDHLDNLESQIQPEFNQALSRRIDNTQLIIEG